jgi:hypothetical protein
LDMSNSDDRKRLQASGLELIKASEVWAQKAGGGGAALDGEDSLEVKFVLPWSLSYQKALQLAEVGEVRSVKLFFFLKKKKKTANRWTRQC